MHLESWKPVEIYQNLHIAYMQTTCDVEQERFYYMIEVLWRSNDLFSAGVYDPRMECRNPNNDCNIYIKIMMYCNIDFISKLEFFREKML